MALTQLKTGAIADDAVTTDKLANAINTERTANTAKVSTTINNNADNKIITGSGTANTLEGEALAQIDSGGDLWIGHAPTTHYDNRKMFIHQPTAGETAYLSITGEQGAGIVFGDSVGQDTGNYESLIWHNNSDDSLKITTDNGNKGIKIENGGDVEVIDGNVKFADGHGIDFSATSGSGTSELFDDYEEGTWTPAFTGATGSISVAGYSLQAGKYTKIGNLVYIEGQLRGQVTNNSTGTWDISGLPFTIDTNSTAAVFVCYDQHAWTRAPHNFAGIPNSTLMRGREGIDVGDTGYTNSNSDCFNAANTDCNRVFFTGCYRTA